MRLLSSAAAHAYLTRIALPSSSQCKKGTAAWLAGAVWLAGAGNKTRFIQLTHSPAALVHGRWCWPGSSAYIDGLSPAAMDWWADQYQPANWKGSTLSLYLWNDMNEPSVFNGPEVCC